jgi:hypothetical protein
MNVVAPPPENSSTMESDNWAGTRDALKEFNRKITPSIVEGYLIEIGVIDAVKLLLRIFGRADVHSALSKQVGRPATLACSTKHEIVWLLIEARRTAKQCTVKDAAESISRGGGIPYAGGESLKTAPQISKALYDADDALKTMGFLKGAMVSAVQRTIIDWRKSGKSYDAFERGLLQKPGWAIREKTRARRK